MYKPGQGMTSRIGAVVLLGLFGLYTSHSAYRVLLGEWPWVDLVVPVVVFLGILAVGAWVALFRAGSSDFLIEMDAELRKVVWPDTQPMFSPKAEAWAATYVVIVTVIVLTLFIYVTDQVLTLVWQQGALRILY